MRFGSLFSGIGGFDLGFERAGMECVWQCEIDKHAQTVLRKHFNAEVYDDVRTIGRGAGAVDLICGGFPCQDLSVAGKRAGLAGERSGLWFEFARVIDELEPRWVVIENVPGLLSSNRGRDFAVILRWLVERGYGVSWRILDAQFFGVPQRRRRVFVVGSFGNGRAAEVLFESEGLRWDTPTRREAGKDVAYSLRANPLHSGDKGDGGVNTTLVPALANAITTKEGLRYKIDQETFLVSTVDDGRQDRPNGGMYVNRVDQANGISSKSELFVREMSHASEAVRDSGEIAPTLQQRMGTGGNQVPLVGIRRLTPTECERLQGFPDGWTDGQADTQRYKQLGNAVAVPCAEWIGRRINA